MSKRFWQVIKVTPFVLSASFLAAQGAIANPMPDVNSSIANPNEALSVLKNRPNLDKVKQFNNYANDEPMSQVTSVSELQDVAPTDWAYEALRSLVERYGCIVGYPDRTYRGNRSLSRWEFAAGLNACMNVVERLIQENVAVLREDIDKLKRLTQEFEQELAALGTRVDNLQARVSFLEEHQFSTTTKLNGEVIFSVGNAWGGEFKAVNSGVNKNSAAAKQPFGDETFLSDRVRLNLDTSFTGKDRLRVRLQATNTPNLQTATGTNMARLAWDVAGTNNDVFVDDLYYRFPVGSQITAWVGANGLDIDDIFNVVNPFMESSGSGALSRFERYNPLVYRGSQGTGVGVKYKFDKTFSLTALYLAEQNQAPNPGAGRGLFNGNYSAGAQLEYNPTDTITLALTYLHTYNGCAKATASATASCTQSIDLAGGTGSSIASNPFFNAPATRDSYGIEGNWRITPGINFSAWGGYALATAQGFDNTTRGPNGGPVNRQGFGADLWTWNGALSFVDLGKEGAVLSFSGGLLTRAPRVAGYPGDPVTQDQNAAYIIETQYKYPLNKNILLTPGVYVIFNPNSNSANPTVYVGVLRTTFTF